MTERLDNRQFELLAATVTAALGVHLGHLPTLLALSLAIMIGLRVWTRRHGAARVAAWIRLPLTVLLVAVVIASFGNLFGREPGTQLGCGLLALKLLETERPRDARVALGFAAFVLMSALLFTQTFAFTLLICVVLILLIAALVALQPAPLVPSRPLRGELRLATTLLAAGLPLAAAAFILVPRLGSPLWGSPGGDPPPRTGLGPTMAPGQFTDLLIDDSPAMRVAFDSSPPPQRLLYFRAVVMWDFDGTTWSRGHWRDYMPAEKLTPAPASPDTLFAYTATLEPSDQRWLPTLDIPLAAPANAHLGSDSVLIASAPVIQPRQYRVRSTTDYVLGAQLDRRQRTSAVDLPAGFDPKTHELAARWRAQGLDEAAIVAAALNLFHASFTYTLSPPLLGRNSVDDFLFETRSGFCEHYSSAFVVLMRAAGIPARVVTGYQGGWWNDAGGYLLVRQSDAHAWAEVWLDGRGWVRVDPTAAVSPERIERGAAAADDSAGWSRTDWLRAMRNQLDFANRLWTEGIIQFNSLRQKTLLSRLGASNANEGDLLLALSATLAIALLLATIWAMAGGTFTQADALDRAWMQLRSRLQRRGLTARSNEGPLDLLQRALKQGSPALAAALQPLVQRYVDLRYGHDTISAAQVSAFARAVRRVTLPRVEVRTGSATDKHSAASG